MSRSEKEPLRMPRKAEVKEVTTNTILRVSAGQSEGTVDVVIVYPRNGKERTHTVYVGNKQAEVLSTPTAFLLVTEWEEWTPGVEDKTYFAREPYLTAISLPSKE